MYGTVQTPRACCAAQQSSQRDDRVLAETWLQGTNGSKKQLNSHTYSLARLHHTLMFSSLSYSLLQTRKELLVTFCADPPPELTDTELAQTCPTAYYCKQGFQELVAAMALPRELPVSKELAAVLPPDHTCAPIHSNIHLTRKCRDTLLGLILRQLLLMIGLC